MISKVWKERRYFIGGSDARIIMGTDEAALLRLWHEKRGEIEPEDLSVNLIVQLGLATEDLNRRWYQANSRQVLIDIQRQIRHPALHWMAATLDGRVEATGAVFESKFMLPWSFSEEAAAEKQMPQLQHNMWVVAELLHEIEALCAADDAALWARRRLPAKNQLSATDTQQVEKAFAAKFVVTQTQSAKSDDVLSEPSLAEQTSAARQIDKTALVFPEPRRVRDRDHIRHVIKQPCLVCSRRPFDPHHLRFAQSRALGRKVSDEFTVPLCRGHHRELHRYGDEAGWWKKFGLDPNAAARALWLTSHPQPKSVI